MNHRHNGYHHAHLKELQRILACSEDSQHQFQREINHPNSLTAELIVLSNSGGGRIFIGVEDNRRISLRQLIQQNVHLSDFHIGWRITGNFYAGCRLPNSKRRIWNHRCIGSLARSRTKNG